MNQENNVKRLYDPTLKKAMNAIAEVLDRYNIAGSVVLVSETHAETRHFFHIPSWSLISEEKDMQTGIVKGIRLTSKRDHFDNYGEQKLASELAMHILCQSKDHFARSFLFLDNFISEISRKWDVQHTPDKGYLPHRDIMDDIQEPE